MIEVNQNSIIIRDVKDEDFVKLNKKFSTFDHVSKQYVMPIYTTINSDVYLPRSVGVSFIESMFPDKAVQYNVNTAVRWARIEMNMKNQPRDELQSSAISFLSRIRANNDSHERFLALPTGKGKTFVTINIIQILKLRTIIMVDTMDLAEQWKNQIMFHSDVKEEEIGIISGHAALERECKLSDKKIYIGMIRTFSNAMEKDPNSISKTMRKLKIGFRVFDEAHTSFQAVCAIVSLSDVDSTLYLTATPNRSNFSENTVYARVFKSIPYFDGKFIENDKYHTVVLHKINTLPNYSAMLSMKTKYGFSLQRWAKYILEDSFSIYIDDLIDNIIKKFGLIEREKKVAILLPTLELIDKTEAALKEEFPDIDVSKFIGTIKKNERAEALKHHFILTNDKMFGKAIDVPGLEVLINYVQVASAVKTEQVIGRLRKIKGKNSILFDITDIGFSELNHQLLARKRFYKKKAKKILEES